MTDMTNDIEKSGEFSSLVKEGDVSSRYSNFRSNYVERFSMILILGSFSLLVIILSISSATFDKVDHFDYPDTVTTAYNSLGIPGYESYNWKDIETLAVGGSVNFYVAVTPAVYNWITTWLSDKLYQDYSITVNYLNSNPSDSSKIPKTTPEIIQLIKNSLTIDPLPEGKDKGDIDVVWINGENFYDMKSNNLLYGPFANKIPSSINFNFEAPTIKYDFEVPTAGLEMPFNVAQIAFIYNSTCGLNDTSSISTVLDIASLIKTANYRNKFTYAMPSNMTETGSNIKGKDFTGSSFTRQVFYEVIGAGSDPSFCQTWFSLSVSACQSTLKYSYKDFTETKWDTGNPPSKYIKVAPFYFSFLRQLEPYLYNEPLFSGKYNNYPSSNTVTDSLFSSGKVFLTLNYNANYASRFSDAKGYTLSTGTLSNTNFLAIPINAKNKLAALVTLNYISSAAAMFQRKSSTWAPLQAYDETSPTFTSEGSNWNVAFETLPTNPHVPTRNQLVQARIPELSVAYINQLERDWYYCVLHFDNLNIQGKPSYC